MCSGYSVCIRQVIVSPTPKVVFLLSDNVF